MSVLDSISPKEIGSRLKSARSSARRTQEEAAVLIGVARTTIVAIEAGERQVRPAELTKLAEFYGVSVNSLLRESSVHIDLVPQFRRSVSARDDEDSSLGAVRLLQKLAARSVELERALGKKWGAVSFPEYRIPRVGWQEQAEDLALEVRQRLGLGLGPIADIFVLLEMDMGVRLFVHRIPSRISGLFAFHEEVGACMLVNSVHPIERRIWTCAHELAHFLTNRHAADISWVDRQERNIEERFADRFAASFLMPASFVRFRFGEVYESANKFSPKDLVLLARTFSVSVEATARRLEQLGLVPNGTYESLVEQGFSVRAANELLGLAGSPPENFIPRLTWLVLEAYRKSLLTEGQVAEILDADRLKVRKMISSLLGDSEVEEEAG